MSARAMATRCNCPPEDLVRKAAADLGEGEPDLVQRAIDARLDASLAWKGVGGREEVSLDALQRIERLEGVLEHGLHVRHERQPLAAERTAATSCPRKRTAPLLGATRPRIMRDNVVLPLPDSPMMVNTSGVSAGSTKLTLSTALKWVPANTDPRR